MSDGELKGPSLSRRFEKRQAHSDFSNADFLPVGVLSDLLTGPEIKDQMSKLELKCTKEFVDFVKEHAKRVFAILVFSKLVRHASHLLEYKFMDKHLPMLRDSEGNRATSFNLLADDQALRWFQTWDDTDDLLAFERGQWFFLAPEFTQNSTMEQPHDRCPLPILKWVKKDPSHAGSFSILYQGEIHKDHAKWLGKVSHLSYLHVLSSRFLTLSQCQVVAIKELNDKNITEKAYEIEVDALGLTRRVNHLHLVKFIAGFQQKQKDYLMFQWVDGGDLNTFWTTHEWVRDERLFGWALKQFNGLADGLRELHKRNCRHTDLKPNNILRSRKPESFGHFQIADLGLAKVHVLPTSLRRVSTTNIAGAGRYQPPEEAETWRKGSRSRSYDLWSMGCILLEFIIWLLLGKTGWEKFNQSFPGPFFSLQESNSVHPAVDEWIQHLRKTCLDSSELRCVSPALRDLLDHVCTRLLVKDPRREEDSGSNDGDVNLLPDRTDEPIPSVIVTRPTYRIVEETGEPRAKIEELCKQLSKICSNDSPGYFFNALTARSVGTIKPLELVRHLDVGSGGKRQLQIADPQVRTCRCHMMLCIADLSGLP